MSSVAVVVSRTWLSDAKNFNFLASEGLDTRIFAVGASASCVRTAHGVAVLPAALPSAPDAEALLRLAQDAEGRFHVEAPIGRLWRAVQRAALHRLAEGDLLRLGHSKFRVQQLVERHGELPRFGATPPVPCRTQSEGAQGVCRICLQEGAEEGDPLCTPCACKGSVADVHASCLRHWLSTKLRQSASGGFACEVPRCELCKQVLPSHVQEQNSDCVRHALFEMPPVEPPFLVLESVGHKGAPGQGTCHVLSLANGHMAKMGRAADCDIRVSNSGVSRWHASVCYCAAASGVEAGFFLEDNRSKFGTAVAMRKRQALEPGVPVAVLVGNTLLEITQKAAFDPASLGMVPIYARAVCAEHCDSELMTEQTRSRSDSSFSAEIDSGTCGRSS